MPYCQYCGTKLDDGQTCTCEMSQGVATTPSIQSVQSASQQQSAPASPRRLTLILRGFKAYLAAYIKNPIQAVRSEVESTCMSTSVILVAVRIIAMGLVVYGLLSKPCDEATTLFKGALKEAVNGIGWAKISTAGISVPLGQSLISGALIAVVGMLMFVVMLFVLVKVQKGDMSIAKVFKANSVNGVLTSLFLVFAYVSSFFSVAFCIVFLALAMLSWMICGVLAASVVSPKKDSGTLWILYFIGIVLVIVGGYYVMPTLFFDAVGSITLSYSGQTLELKTIFETISESLSSEWNNLVAKGDFLNSFLEEMFSEIVWEYFH